jgi:hypothetical protein
MLFFNIFSHFSSIYEKYRKNSTFFCNRFFSGTGSGVPDRGAAGER